MAEPFCLRNAAGGASGDVSLRTANNNQTARNVFISAPTR